MPFLWDTVMTRLTSFKSPSPKHRKHSVLGYPIEKASLPAFLKGGLPAGMTVEAAIVLPLFLFFFVNLGSAMEMIRLHGNLQTALWDVGNRMCVYGYAADNSRRIENAVSAGEDEGDGAWWRELGDIALSYTYIKSQVVNYAGEDYLESSPLSYGVGGLQFWESDVLGADQPVNGDILDIVMTYQVSPWLQIPYVRPFRMSNRYYGRLWTGYELHAGSSEAGDAQDVVYITENASVYHESRDCTHLKLHIREVTIEEAKIARNGSGERYRECLTCSIKHPCRDKVAIAAEGNAYHYDRDCPGLKRTIYTIPRQQASKYRPCSRCAAAP